MLTRTEAPLATPGDGFAPMTHGVGVDQNFYSLDAQAGRAAVLVLVGRLTPAESQEALANLRARAPEFAAANTDLVALVDIAAPQAAAYAAEPAEGPRIVFSKPDVFEAWGFRNVAPALVAIDPGLRMLAGPVDGAPASVAALLDAVAAVPREDAFDDMAPAPVLVVPNVLSRDLCRDLIAHFEAGKSEFGGMASVDAEGGFLHKVDYGKKHRYDLVLGPRDPYLNRVLAGVVTRIIPEIKKAFQVDICHTDRLLIARYDETGGYFKRHRDNVAPSIAFRQFALSINLNADFDGGQVLFPEYNHRRYKPPAGAGVVFSCSLLHEAAAVTKGNRYVVLTFLHDAAAQARWLQQSRRAS